MLVKTFAGYKKEGHWMWAQRSSHGMHNKLEAHRHDYIELVYVVHGEAVIKSAAITLRFIPAAYL
ncbi:hypothetical protein LJK88_46445 [Paenibacillus sp. P26]|nr:hypothetical protein LJK88_46445 [Paenibacillus sp. P26]